MLAVYSTRVEQGELALTHFHTWCKTSAQEVAWSWVQYWSWVHGGIEKNNNDLGSQVDPAVKFVPEKMSWKSESWCNTDHFIHKLYHKLFIYFILKCWIVHLDIDS